MPTIGIIDGIAAGSDANAKNPLRREPEGVEFREDEPQGRGASPERKNLRRSREFQPGPSFRRESSVISERNGAIFLSAGMPGPLSLWTQRSAPCPTRCRRPPATPDGCQTAVGERQYRSLKSRTEAHPIGFDNRQSAAQCRDEHRFPEESLEDPNDHLRRCVVW